MSKNPKLNENLPHSLTGTGPQCENKGQGVIGDYMGSFFFFFSSSELQNAFS